MKLNENKGRMGLFFALVLVILGLLIYLNRYIAGGGGNWEASDFMLIWLGGRGVTDGTDIYNEADWEALHQKYAGSYRDNPIFLYPLPAAFLFTPFSLSTIDRGATTWLLANELLLIITLAYFFSKEKFKPKLTKTTILVFAVAIFQPMLIVIGSGQYSIAMVNLLLLSYIFIDEGKDLAAGICLSLLLFRFSAVILVWPVILLWAVWKRRWRLVISTGIISMLMFIIAELFRPSWLQVWLSYTLSGKGKLTTYAPLTQTLTGMVFDLGKTLSLEQKIFLITGISVITLIIGVSILWLKREQDLLLWIALFTAISLFLTPYAWNYDQLLLLVPILIIITRGEKSTQSNRVQAWIYGLTILVVLPYLFRGVAIQRQIDTLSGILSIITILYVIWAILAFTNTHKSITPQ